MINNTESQKPESKFSSIDAIKELRKSFSQDLNKISTTKEVLFKASEKMSSTWDEMQNKKSKIAEQERLKAEVTEKAEQVKMADIQIEVKKEVQPSVDSPFVASQTEKAPEIKNTVIPQTKPENLNNNLQQNNGYQPRPQNSGYQSNNNGYQPRPQYNNNNNGYQNNNSGYQPRPQYNNNNNGYQNNNSGYQPRPQYNNNNSGYQNNNSGTYQPRPQYNNNGNYQNNNGYQPRPQYNNNNGGTFQPRPQFNNSGSQSNSNGGFQPRTGGYQQGFNGQRPYTPRYNNGTSTGTTGFQPRPFGQGGFQPRTTTGGFQQRPQQAGFNRNAGNKSTLEPLPDSMRTKEFFNKKKTEPERDEKRVLSKRQKMKIFGFEDLDGDTHMGSRKLKAKKEKEAINIVSVDNVIISQEKLTVKELSEKISKPVSEIIKKLIELGMLMTINSVIDFSTAELVAGEFGVKVEKKLEKTYEEKIKESHKSDDNDQNKIKRPPVVAVLGHVDHGKTSLLDALRKTDIATHESGGITQHIGAYSIVSPKGRITFIDTPGHAAFSAIRERGAKATDIAILVVAADDGVMLQTKEAIKHIQEAKVPLIVAINKMDVHNANPERVKQQLSECGVLPEEWGGDAIIVPISAKTGAGIDKLLESIILVADMQELKANPDVQASGTILEAKLDKNRGALATLLIQDGTLKVGDTIVAGTAFGKVKTILNDLGATLKEAGPSIPAFVVGLDEVPHAGDHFYVVDSNMSRKLIAERKTKIKEDRIQSANMSADDFLAKVDASKITMLKLIVKADVQGSAEALKSTLESLSNEEVKVACISSTAGLITENDVILAKTSEAKLIAFNIKIDARTANIASKQGVEIKTFKIIYEAVDYVTAEVKKLKVPKFEEQILGNAEVRFIFKLSSFGTVAGSMVKSGKIKRGAKARIIRNGEVITTDDIEGLRIQKDDQKEVGENFECGIKLSKFTAYQIGDIVECFVLNQIKE